MRSTKSAQKMSCSHGSGVKSDSDEFSQLMCTCAYLILHGKELSILLLLGDIIAIRYEMAGSIVHVDVQMFLSLLCI